jgi:hypothetical protein
MSGFGLIGLLTQRALVFFGAPVLGELNDKDSEGGKQNDMPHSAFMQQKLSDQPNDENQTSGDPEHLNSFGFQILRRGYCKALTRARSNLGFSKCNCAQSGVRWLARDQDCSRSVRHQDNRARYEAHRVIGN